MIADLSIIVTIVFGISALAIAVLFFWSWRMKSYREHEYQLQQLKLEEKHREEDRDAREMERYENRERQQREEEIELGKIAGAGTGGYIIFDLPDDKRPLFHDLLKGFEDYAKLKGYTISFSVDASFNNRIAFKFTLKDIAVNIGTERVRQDFKEYVNKVRSGESLDSLPVIISLEEHELLVTALKNRISFLQHSYNLSKNAALYYENLISKIGSMPLLPAQNILVQTGGNMDSRKYKAINSSRLIQGDGNEYNDSSVDASVKIGNSFNERRSQIESLTKLIGAIQANSGSTIQNKEAALKDLNKVKEELEDEAEPDKSRIKKWLERAKGLLGFATLGKDIADLAKQVYDSFGIIT